MSQKKSRSNKIHSASAQSNQHEEHRGTAVADGGRGSPEPAQPAIAPTTPVDSTAVSDKGGWITDKAWVSGVAGALAVVLCAAWYNTTEALSKGVFIGGFQLTENRMDTLLAALIMCAGVMVVAEFVRLLLWHRDGFFTVHPDLRERRFDRFVGESLLHYGLNLGLLALVLFFFRSAGEYGYVKNNAYYQPWFRFLELVWTGYLWGGLPYTIVTRALKFSPDADRRDLVRPWLNALLWIPVNVFKTGKRRPFDEYDKKALRALLVKLFFAPLMTVFFTDQFPHLVNNVGYVFTAIPDMIANDAYLHRRFNNDFFNISVALIFSVDVALAWCGYVVSSRWVDNQTSSAEPTMLGWIVCIICYPPFQMFLGLYYGAPGEREILGFANHQWVITIFTTMMVLSYIVYMSGTLWFGVRFSNLTNRGIIRTGPYGVVRHPAYASKNFAWWCIMFPVIVYNASHSGGLKTAIVQTLGLLLMTWVYYWRAITEERHLSVDPAYRDYCKQVRYRFIPGLI